MTLRCGNGALWTATGCGPCVKCQREADAMTADFWLAVFFGELNHKGYTEAEWVATGRTAQTWRQAA